MAQRTTGNYQPWMNPLLDTLLSVQNLALDIDQRRIVDGLSFVFTFLAPPAQANR